MDHRLSDSNMRNKASILECSGNCMYSLL